MGVVNIGKREWPVPQPVCQPAQFLLESVRTGSIFTLVKPERAFSFTLRDK